MPWTPRLDSKKFLFLFFTFIWQENAANILKVQEFRQSKYGTEYGLRRAMQTVSRYTGESGNTVK